MKIRRKEERVKCEGCFFLLPGTSMKIWNENVNWDRGKDVKSYLVLQCVLHLDSIVVPEQKQLIIKSQPFMVLIFLQSASLYSPCDHGRGVCHYSAVEDQCVTIILLKMIPMCRRRWLRMMIMATKCKNVCIHERLRSGANADPRYDWCCLEILLSGILQKKTAQKIWVFWGNIITPIWQWLWW